MRAETDIRRELEERANVTDTEWAGLVEDRYVSEVELGAAPIEHLEAELLRRRKANGQPVGRPRARRGLTPAHVRAKSALRERDAGERDDVEEARRRYLGGKLIPREEVVAWLEDRALRGEPGDYEPIAYPGPDDRWVCRVQSTKELEPLRRLSESLARSHDWHPAQALAFILSGVTPLVPSIRVTVRRGLPYGSRIILAVDPEEDGEAVDRAYTRIREREFGPVRRVGEKKARLAEFAADDDQKSSWEERMRRWNERYPESTYGDRSNFQRDVTDALRRLSC